MGRRLPIGIQDFRKIRERNYLYVDKTDMISQILDDGAEVFLYTRPRRFGKSLNLSMINEFFNIDRPDNSDLFEGLKISQYGEYDGYRNSHPVKLI